MLSNLPERGLDLMDAMVAAAAERASSHFLEVIRFAKCDDVQVNEGFTTREVDIETWPLFADHQAIVVSVFATGANDDGSLATAASGRFTFTTLTGKRTYRA